MSRTGVAPACSARHECPSVCLAPFIVVLLALAFLPGKAVGDPGLDTTAIQPATLVAQVKANCPSLSDMKCARQVLAAALDSMEVHIGIHLLPLTGQQVAVVKVLDLTKGVVTDFAFDATGNVLVDKGQ